MCFINWYSCISEGIARLNYGSLKEFCFYWHTVQDVCSEVVHHFEAQLNNNERRIVFVIYSMFLLSFKNCGVVFSWEHMVSVVGSYQTC